MVKKTKIADGKFVNPYECANISNDDYTTYPVDTDGNVTQVDVIENGKLFKFITPANAKTRMDKQMVDNLKVGNEATDDSSGDESEVVEETPSENVPPTDKPTTGGETETPNEEPSPSENVPPTGEPTDEEPTVGGEAGESGESGESGEAETPTGSINANVSYD